MSYHKGSINALQNARIWRCGSTKALLYLTLVLYNGDFVDKITTMYFKGISELSA
jgi:hypothetical protein